MQTSRILISSLAAASVLGLAGLAVAQTTTVTPPAANTTTTPGGTTTTITPPMVTTETEAERMNRERLASPANSGSSNQGSVTTNNNTGTSMDSTGRRDANGDLIARADRN